MRLFCNCDKRLTRVEDYAGKNLEFIGNNSKLIQELVKMNTENIESIIKLSKEILNIKKQP